MNCGTSFTNVTAPTPASSLAVTASGDASIGELIGGHKTTVQGDNNHITYIVRQYAAPGGAPPNATEADLRAHVVGYLQWVNATYGTVTLRGIRREDRQVVELDLDEVYVPLEAQLYRPPAAKRAKGQRPEEALEQEARAERVELPLSQLLTQGERLVVIGAPGCGKTTVLQHIAYTLATALATGDATLARRKLGLAEGALPLPVFVPLSDYAAYLRRPETEGQARTLAAFISRYLLRRQSGVNLPADFFERLWRAQPAVLLLLDGLDEVPNEDERAEVRQAVEDLVAAHPALRVVVTCRTAAYQGRAVLGRGFFEARVKPLNTQQRDQLIRQAYARLEPQRPTEATAKADDLIASVENLEATHRRRLGKETAPLVNSPLMVRLLLIVHYSERRLPDQRAELFAKATDALLKPDYALDQNVANQIGGLVGGSMEVHRDLAQLLAFKMHALGPKQGRAVEEADLKRLLADSPHRAHIPDLLALTRTRSTLLEERDRQYRFIHLTFQEYLTARHLAEVTGRDEGTVSIADFLEGGPILESWWREVVLLVVGHLHIDSPTSALLLVERLAGLHPKTPPDRAPNVQLAAAELGALALLEAHSGDAALRQTLAQRMAQLLEAPVTSQAQHRAALGNALAQLGDPRPGLAPQTVNDLLAWEFAYIPPGKFIMGDGDEQHENTILTDGYWLARYPVTVAQWQLFVKESGHKPVDDDSLRGYANHPVVKVTWYEGIKFCEWLNTLNLPGLKNPAGLAYRFALPSEAEWEKAARGGDQLPVHAGANLAGLQDLRGFDPTGKFAPAVPQALAYPYGQKFDSEKANTYETRLGSTSAVGAFPLGASPYGLLDMSGNVWEWCRSKYKPYPYKHDDGREEIDGSDDTRVVRGGSWNFDQVSARAALRGRFDPYYRGDLGGFRVCVRPPSLSNR